MILFIAGVVIGAVGFFLILRNNPSLAKKVAGIVDKIDDKISK